MGVWKLPNSGKLITQTGREGLETAAVLELFVPVRICPTLAAVCLLLFVDVDWQASRIDSVSV